MQELSAHNSLAWYYRLSMSSALFQTAKEDPFNEYVSLFIASDQISTEALRLRWICGIMTLLRCWKHHFWLNAYAAIIARKKKEEEKLLQCIKVSRNRLIYVTKRHNRTASDLAAEMFSISLNRWHDFHSLSRQTQSHSFHFIPSIRLWFCFCASALLCSSEFILFLFLFFFSIFSESRIAFLKI